LELLLRMPEAGVVDLVNQGYVRRVRVLTWL
jgi:hypothetical protein